jgi:hypothetical protein
MVIFRGKGRGGRGAAETACTVPICVCSSWNHKSSTGASSSISAACACLLDRSTQMATPIRPRSPRTVTGKRLPNVSTFSSAVLGLPLQLSAHRPHRTPRALHKSAEHRPNLESQPGGIAKTVWCSQSRFCIATRCKWCKAEVARLQTVLTAWADARHL